MLNVTHQAVSKWERGESLPDIGLLPLTAKTLGITVDELLQGELKVSKDDQPQVGEQDELLEVETHPMHAEEDVDAPGLTLEQIVQMAPFLSAEVLEEAVETAEGEVQWQTVHFLAPFLSRASLERLVDRILDGEYELERITVIAPFLGKAALERLVQQAEVGSARGDMLVRLGPFLPRQALAQLARRLGPIAAEHLVALAPFLDSTDLEHLLKGRR